MSYSAERVYRSSSMSHVEDPNADELQGYVSDDPMESLVHLREVRYRWGIDPGKLMVLLSVAFAIVLLCVGIGMIVGGKDDTFFVNGDPNKVIPPVPENLHVVCAPMNLELEQGYNDCLELCQPAQCCEFIPENKLSCVERNREECNTYRASCQHLDHKKATADEMTPDKACSTTSLMTEEGVKACKGICEPFKCCFDSSSECDVSDAICYDNGACAIALLVDDDGLDNHSEGTTTIDVACLDTTVAGQTHCAHVCNPAQCCFETFAQPNSPCPVNCTHYESCSILYGVLVDYDDFSPPDEFSFSIPHEVEQACNPAQLQTVPGVKACLELCQHHMCCFDFAFGGGVGCLESNPDECMLYSACQALLPKTNSTNRDPAKSCDAAHVGYNGPKKCLQACASSYCCLFDTRYQASCANEDKCSTTFQACQILAPEKPGVENPDAVATINKFCTLELIATTEGAMDCMDACDERGCCVDTLAGNCQNSDKEYCDEVSSCQLILEEPPDQSEGEGSKTDPPNAVTVRLGNTCNEDNLSTLSGYHNCYDECYYHLCCFQDDGFVNCKDEKGELECAEYAPCAVLLDTSGVGSYDLGYVCSSSSIATTDGLNECRKQCAQRLCCFQDPNLPSSCIGWYGHRECDEYEPCKVLISDSSHTLYNDEDPYLVALIANYCKPENVVSADDARHCMAQCEKRSCCFVADGCYETNKDWCDEVLACTNHPLLDIPSNSTVGNVTPASDGDASNNSTAVLDEATDTDTLGDSNSTVSSEGSLVTDTVGDSITPVPADEGGDETNAPMGGNGPGLFGGSGDSGGSSAGSGTSMPHHGLDLFGGGANQATTPPGTDAPNPDF